MLSAATQKERMGSLLFQSQSSRVGFGGGDAFDSPPPVCCYVLWPKQAASPKALRAGAGSEVSAPARPKSPRSGARLVLGQRPAARCRSLPLNIIPLPGGNFNALYTSEAIKKENVRLKTSPQNFSTQGCGKGGKGDQPPTIIHFKT